MRLRFTIRDLFWLTLMAALAVGGFMDHKWLTRGDRLSLVITEETPVHDERADSDR
jgi:hypothetical protein